VRCPVLTQLHASDQLIERRLFWKFGTFGPAQDGGLIGHRALWAREPKRAFDLLGVECHVAVCCSERLFARAHSLAGNLFQDHHKGCERTETLARVPN
jgi:hypothetical protein